LVTLEPLRAVARRKRRVGVKTAPAMTTNATTPNLARELTALATEVDSLEKRLLRCEEELAREAERRKRFEQKAADLSIAVAQARQRATTAERDLARLATELESRNHTAVVREHELETRLSEANATIERLRRELVSKERQRIALETDLADVMQNLRHAASEAAWPSRQNAEPTVQLNDESEPTHFGW
jgi:chromosome segregation ATPase